MRKLPRDQPPFSEVRTRRICHVMRESKHMAEAQQAAADHGAQEDQEQLAANKPFQPNSDNSISPDLVSTEQFVGNLCAHISLPTEHVGQVCKGNLIFDACFEGGI